MSSIASATSPLQARVFVLPLVVISGWFNIRSFRQFQQRCSRLADACSLGVSETGLLYRLPHENLNRFLVASGECGKRLILLFRYRNLNCSRVMRHVVFPLRKG